MGGKISKRGSYNLEKSENKKLKKKKSKGLTLEDRTSSITALPEAIVYEDKIKTGEVQQNQIENVFATNVYANAPGNGEYSYVHVPRKRISVVYDSRNSERDDYSNPDDERIYEDILEDCQSETGRFSSRESNSERKISNQSGTRRRTWTKYENLDTLGDANLDAKRASHSSSERYEEVIERNLGENWKQLLNGTFLTDEDTYAQIELHKNTEKSPVTNKTSKEQAGENEFGENSVEHIDEQQEQVIEFKNNIVLDSLSSEGDKYVNICNIQQDGLNIVNEKHVSVTENSNVERVEDRKLNSLQSRKAEEEEILKEEEIKYQNYGSDHHKEDDKERLLLLPSTSFANKKIEQLEKDVQYQNVENLISNENEPQVSKASLKVPEEKITVDETQIGVTLQSILLPHKNIAYQNESTNKHLQKKVSFQAEAEQVELEIAKNQDNSFDQTILKHKPLEKSISVTSDIYYEPAVDYVVEESESEEQESFLDAEDFEAEQLEVFDEAQVEVSNVIVTRNGEEDAAPLVDKVHTILGERTQCEDSSEYSIVEVKDEEGTVPAQEEQIEIGYSGSKHNFVEISDKEVVAVQEIEGENLKHDFVETIKEEQIEISYPAAEYNVFEIKDQEEAAAAQKINDDNLKFDFVETIEEEQIKIDYSGSKYNVVEIRDNEEVAAAQKIKEESLKYDAVEIMQEEEIEIGNSVSKYNVVETIEEEQIEIGYPAVAYNVVEIRDEEEVAPAQKIEDESLKYDFVEIIEEEQVEIDDSADHVGVCKTASNVENQLTLDENADKVTRMQFNNNFQVEEDEQREIEREHNDIRMDSEYVKSPASDSHNIFIPDNTMFKESAEISEKNSSQGSSMTVLVDDKHKIVDQKEGGLNVSKALATDDVKEDLIEEDAAEEFIVDNSPSVVNETVSGNDSKSEDIILEEVDIGDGYEGGRIILNRISRLSVLYEEDIFNLAENANENQTTEMPSFQDEVNKLEPEQTVESTVTSDKLLLKNEFTRDECANKSEPDDQIIKQYLHKSDSNETKSVGNEAKQYEFGVPNDKEEFDSTKLEETSNKKLFSSAKTGGKDEILQKPTVLPEILQEKSPTPFDTPTSMTTPEEIAQNQMKLWGNEDEEGVAEAISQISIIIGSIDNARSQIDNLGISEGDKEIHAEMCQALIRIMREVNSINNHNFNEKVIDLQHKALNDIHECLKKLQEKKILVENVLTLR